MVSQSPIEGEKVPLIDKGENKKDLSYFGGWLVLTNAMIGASIVALPYVVKISGGIFQYLLLLSCATIGNIITMVIYVNLAEETGSRFAFELLERVVKSKTISHIYMAGFILKTYTILLVSITFFADQFAILFEIFFGDSLYEERAQFYRFLSVLACAILAAPFLVPKKINMLQIPGILTLISSISIIILTIFIYADERRGEERKELVVPKNETSFLDFVGAVPIVMLGLAAHEMSIICYDSVGETRQKRHWYKVIAGLFTFSISAFVLVGVMGYEAFGDAVQDDFLLNCNPKSANASIARVAMMMSVLASFVERFYMSRYYCDSVYRKMKQLDFEEGERTWTVRRHIETIAIMICVIIPASFIHGFKDVGNFAGIFICFTTFGLPGLCLVAKFKHSRDKRKEGSSRLRSENSDSESEYPKQRTDCDSGILNLIMGVVILLAFAFVLVCAIVSAVYILIVD
ncbi:sodium-coupled neutral amino acid transporter 7-like isoform X2 [Convolutriloba macropyga]|uniref:sodium-coupled neutral amino acid transporter 7-like isoform X2 n=2 Tax=Convolutriloba macropyga TaxID=536237 RepID=UPI003F5283A2